MLVVVKTGVANITSVTNALDKIGHKWQLSDCPERVAGAEKVILPGVGAAATAMARLEEKGLVTVLQNFERPLLGICLGMQILFETLEEGQGCSGLGVIPGHVRKLDVGTAKVLPHMGWNQVSPESGSQLLGAASEWFYFVHTFRVDDGPHTKGKTEYGETFCSVVEHKNFMGTQFHPEKSAAAGSALLKRFVAL